ncbi:UNKNOWN [Stylonychia lemnae]|uniref:Uncharacterized protein n=1 Tax=Stylonychia lemnae TaxID=5949 RepID=A0A078ARJ9_STYLE|nr:UNKNOWN [Stylonychia lemnae]|eukprot:CDW83837.1 UNKNOWN [Stylonychia lemnae]
MLQALKKQEKETYLQGSIRLQNKQFGDQGIDSINYFDQKHAEIQQIDKVKASFNHDHRSRNLIGGIIWRSQLDKPETSKQITKQFFQPEKSSITKESPFQQTVYDNLCGDIPSSVYSSMALTHQKIIQQDLLKKVYRIECMKCRKTFKNSECICPHCFQKESIILEVQNLICSGYMSDEQIDDNLNQSSNNDIIDSNGSDEEHFENSGSSEELRGLLLEQNMNQDNADNLKFQFMIQLDNNKQEEVQSKLNLGFPSKDLRNSNNNNPSEIDIMMPEKVDDKEVEQQLKNLLRNAKVCNSSGNLNPSDFPSASPPIIIKRNRSDSPRIAIFKDIDTSSIDENSQITTKQSTTNLNRTSKQLTPTTQANLRNFSFPTSQVDQSSCVNFNKDIMRSLISRKMENQKTFYELKVLNNFQSIYSLSLMGNNTTQNNGQLIHTRVAQAQQQQPYEKKNSNIFTDFILDMGKNYNNKEIPYVNVKSSNIKQHGLE